MVRRRVILLLLLMLVWIWCSAAKKVRIPDNLDDVVDDEEDEEWIAWGKKRSQPVFDPPPDFEGMTPQQIQQEMIKRHVGPSMGFVKLRLDVPRTKDDLTHTAKRWTKLLRTGGIGARVTAVDLNTLMFTIDHGQDVLELKDFVLSQPEAYEFKVGQQAYRRPGDPPLEVVIERRRQKEKEIRSNDEL